MADGSIIIDTRIDTGGVSKGMNAVKAGMARISAQVSKMGDSAKSSFQRQITAITGLYQNYEKQERKVSELKSKLEELSKVRIETEEYKKLKDDIKALEDEFEKVETKQREWLDMGFSIDSAPLQELDKQMDDIWADIDRLQRKQKEMQTTGRAYVDPTSTDAYKSTAEKCNVESQKLEHINGRLYSSYNKLKNKVEEYRQKNSRLVQVMQNLQKAAARVGMVVKNMGSALRRAGSAIKSMVSAMKKAVENMFNLNKQTDRSRMSLSRMLGMSLLFSGVSRAISAVSDGVKSGFENLAQYSKRYSAYGRSTKECAENELRIREEIKAGLYNSNKNITLDAYFDEWEKSRRGTIKDSSIKINRSKYNNHIRPVLGKIKVQKIEKRAVVKLQQDLSKKLSASMTNGVIVLLKTVLNAAVDDEILMKNPAASVKPLRKDDRPKASETIHRALTREEQQAFMQEAKTEWLYEFFCFSLCTGMRLNEITALKWQDIDYINNVIRVNKTVSWKEGGGIEETLPKSDTSNRDIPMNDTIKKILQMQKTKMSMVYGEIHARKMDSNIFIGSNGAKAIASSTVSSAIDNVLKRLRQQDIEIERFTHHAFRDTFATRYIEEGGNMQTLQKILGHSSLAMTADLYAHVLPNTKQQEMQQIENGFIGVAVL